MEHDLRSGAEEKLYKYTFSYFQRLNKSRNFLKAFGDDARPVVKMRLTYVTGEKPTDEYINRMTAYINTYDDSDYSFEDAKLIGVERVKDG